MIHSPSTTTLITQADLRLVSSLLPDVDDANERRRALTDKSRAKLGYDVYQGKIGVPRAAAAAAPASQPFTIATLSKTVPLPKLALANKEYAPVTINDGFENLLPHVAPPKEPTAEQRRASLHVVALQAKGLIASKDAADLHELLGVKFPVSRIPDPSSPGTRRDQRRRTATKQFTTHIMRKTQSGTELLIKDSRVALVSPAQVSAAVSPNINFLPNTG